jgi:hypothetical protein
VTKCETRNDLFPTGVGGVLYPPGSLDPEVMNEGAALATCPSADDVWLYWMAKRAGTQWCQVGGGFPQIVWPGSQATSLLSENVGRGANDRALAAVQKLYAA